MQILKNIKIKYNAKQYEMRIKSSKNRNRRKK